MASRLDDRWIWMGLGVVLFAAAKGIGYGLRDIAVLNEIHDPEHNRVKHDERLEDAIPLKSLETLCKSPNTEIANASISLLLNRFLLSSIDREAWADDLFSSSYGTRQRAKRVKELIEDLGLAHDIPTPEVLRLKGLIDRSIDSDTESARTIRTAYHAAQRRRIQGHDRAWNALKRLSAVMDRAERSVPLLTLPESAEGHVVNWARAQRRRIEVDVYQRDLMYREAVAAMRGSPDELEVNDEDESGRTRFVEPGFEREYDLEGLRTEFEDSIHWREQSGRIPRFHEEESPEETRLRRRRREAMVLHETDGPIGREDIIQPSGLV